MRILPIKIKRKSNQSGQALLLVLLSMAAVLTVVLSAASRSINNVSITSSEEDALRAFSAAEAGVERSLLTGESNSGSPDPADSTVSFDSVVQTLPEGNDFVYPGLLNAGESATFWFAERTATGGYTCAGGNCVTNNRIKTLCWGTNSPYASGEIPAVLLTVFYDTTKSYLSGNYANIKVARKGFDPVSARASNNRFSIADGGPCTIGQTSFSYSKRDIQFNPTDLGIPPTCSTGCMILAKVRVFYNNATKPEQIGMDLVGGGGNSLPPQGNRIESTGVAGESSRKVNVFQSFAEPPSIFDAAVFSMDDFSKN